MNELYTEPVIKSFEQKWAEIYAENQQLTADNARLRERIAELEAQSTQPCVHDRVKEWLNNEGE